MPVGKGTQTNIKLPFVCFNKRAKFGRYRYCVYYTIAIINIFVCVPAYGVPYRELIYFLGENGLFNLL